MKDCHNCGKQVSEGVSFCPFCGKSQQVDIIAQSNTFHGSGGVSYSSAPSQSDNSVLLIVFSILTILASVVGLFWSSIYSSTPTGSSGNNLWYFWFFLHLTTLVGAALMLGKLKAGLYVYTIGEVLYIVYILYVFFLNDVGGRGRFEREFFNAMRGFIAMAIVIGVAFIIIYWLPASTKHFKKQAISNSDSEEHTDLV